MLTWAHTTYELDLTVNPRPAIQCSNDTIVEYGSTVTLTALGADSYLWSTGETTESVSRYNNGIYIVHVRCLGNHYYKKLIIQH